ncbi:hypothetical protein P5673_033706 [Acropora cervicornis]|uniref:Uncharacterized protein n=1 Tax=Acropora cervicornis TaxID=6130 RepID=A0AAD9UR32_ACRCE|nr:hypothetical protein P5673_033706 [Acropora cervicornis]
MFESINFQICRKFIKLRTVSCSAIDSKIVHTFVGIKLLYELYKSAQQEADDREEELDPEGSLGKTTTNSVLRILIQKVGMKCGIPLLKIWRLNQALAKAKTKVGNGVKKLFSQWTKGRFSTWTFKIYNL